MKIKLGFQRKPKDEIPQVGVVFVHGIGFQKPGETILEWSGALETALVGWRTRLSDGDIAPGQEWPRDLVETSDVDLTGTRRSYVTVRIPGVSTVDGAGPQRWTFTETYWAAKVEPVSLRLIADWTGREGVIWRVVEGVLRKNTPGAVRPYVLLAGKYWLGLFISAFTSTVLLGWMVIKSVLSLIPIQAVQDFVALGKGERFLVGWWGDARTLVRDPVQSATVRKSLDDSIRYLRKRRGCQKIVVLAHSGGTIVAYMTLSDPGLRARADLLVTHGQAISLGRRLEDLELDTDMAQVQPSVTRISRVAKPEDLRVGAWRDFYGTHDPAPIRTPSDLAAPNPLGSATEVVNLRSIRGDHGGYWTNDEEFVLPVLTEIERVGGGGPASRFTRTGVSGGDEMGVELRHSRVALRSLWGRLALVAPVVAIMLAAGISGGIIDNARGFDVPSDILADNYQRLPFNELGAEISASLTQATEPSIRPIALGITRALLFFVFLVAAVWAFIPTGNRSAMPPWAGGADILLSLAVPLAALIALFGWGPISGAGRPREFDWVMVGVLLFILGSIVLNELWERYDLARFIPPARMAQAWVSLGIITLLLVALGAFVISFIVDVSTRRWIVDGLAAIFLFQAVVRVGMWRWNAWDAAERQWFRGQRTEPSPRGTVYWIGILLAAVAVSLVVILSGLDDVLVGAGWTWMGGFTMVIVILSGLFLLALVVRDASISETAHS